MQSNRASGTAEYTAALRLLTPEFRALVESRNLRKMIEERRLRPTQEHGVLRQRFADDALAAAVARGTRQLVVLAAGLDSSCLRRDPRLSVLEVHHPAS